MTKSIGVVFTLSRDQALHRKHGQQSGELCERSNFYHIIVHKGLIANFKIMFDNLKKK